MKRISDENATVLAVFAVVIFFFLLTFGCATVFYKINGLQSPGTKERTK